MCVVGLGYVGLPTACILATRGHRVHGVDVDPRAVARVCDGRPVAEPGLSELLSEAIASGRLTASADASPADVFVVTVPTPVTGGNLPDISCVLAAIKSIVPHLRGGELVCIESTCPIGTTDALAANLPDNIHIAYCPERMLPGHSMEELLSNDRVVGGVSPVATERAVAFYSRFVVGKVFGTDARTAEMVKLAENAYRDVNIAFANEISMISNRLGVDAREVIRLANRHPRVGILEPGPGVGGHCVAIDGRGCA